MIVHSCYISRTMYYVVYVTGRIVQVPSIITPEEVPRTIVL